MTHHRYARVMLVLLLLICAAPSIAHAQSLVLIVRHGERAGAAAAPGAMTDTRADPPLSPVGEAYAAKLVSVLGDAGIKVIYATEFRRTQDTARPLAAKLGLSIQTMKAADSQGLIAALKQHPRDVVLVVAHSNTLPGIVKLLGGPDVTIGENDYDNLFMIVPATGAMTRIHF